MTSKFRGSQTFFLGGGRPTTENRITSWSCNPNCHSLQHPLRASFMELQGDKKFSVQLTVTVQIIRCRDFLITLYFTFIFFWGGGVTTGRKSVTIVGLRIPSVPVDCDIIKPRSSTAHCAV